MAEVQALAGRCAAAMTSIGTQQASIIQLLEDRHGPDCIGRAFGDHPGMAVEATRGVVIEDSVASESRIRQRLVVS